MTFSLWHSTVSEMTYDNNDYDRNTSPHAAFMHTWQLTYLVCAPCYSCTWFVLRSSDTDSFTRQNNSFADTRRLGVIVDILRTFYNERGLLWLWVEPIVAILTTIRGDHDVPSRATFGGSGVAAWSWMQTRTQDYFEKVIGSYFSVCAVEPILNFE